MKILMDYICLVKTHKKRKLINIQLVEQDLSQGQDSSPDRDLPITQKTLTLNFLLTLPPQMPPLMPGVVQ